MPSFDGASFDERGSGTTFPAWSSSTITVVKHIPGGDTNVIQQLGRDVERVALIVRATKAQLQALYAKVGDSGALVFGFETTNAYLESIGNAEEIMAGQDTYFATLNLIKL